MDLTRGLRTRLGRGQFRVKYSLQAIVLLLAVWNSCEAIERGTVSTGQEENDIRGALVEELGNVMIVQSSLEIHIEFEDMIVFETTVEKIRSHLEQEYNHFKTVHPKIGEINRLLRSISPEPSNRHRQARSLLPFVGGIISNLFGTATESNINNINNKIKRLEAWSSNTNVVIKNTARCVQRMNSLIRNIQELLDNRINKLGDRLEEVKSEMERQFFFDNLYDLLLLWYTEVSNFSRDLILASEGKVTPTLLPPDQLYGLIETAVKTYDFKAINDLTNFQLIYPMLMSTLDVDKVIVSVPFRSNDVYTLYKLHKFPVALNNSFYLYEIENNNIMLSKFHNLVSYPSDEVLDKCVSPILGNYLCPSFLFTFYTTLTKACDIAIIDKTSYKSLCKFKQYNSSTPFVANTIDKHYVHLPQLVSLSISCPSHPTKVVELQGSFTIDTECTVISPQLHILPSRRVNRNINFTAPNNGILRIKSYILTNPKQGTEDDSVEMKNLQRQLENIDVTDALETDMLVPLPTPVKKTHFIVSSAIIATTILFAVLGLFLYLKKYHHILVSLRKLKKKVTPTEDATDSRDHEDAREKKEEDNY